MRIAIVKLSALGDIVHAMVVLQFIKKFNQEILIDWFVEEQYKGLLEAHPHINKVHLVKLKKAKKKKSISILLQEFKKIRKCTSYDVVIDMQGLIKSAIVSKLIPSSKIVGFDKSSARESFASNFYNEKFNINYSENIVKRNIGIINCALNANINEYEIFKKKSFLLAQNKHIFNEISTVKKNVLLVPGASFMAKCYPVEGYIEIVEKIDANFITIWGDEKEKIMAEAISFNSSKVKVCKKLSLDRLISLVSQVDVVLGSDTGPTHMAWALNTKSLTLFGPTPSTRNVFVTDVNMVLESLSEVNPFKIDKSDFSISKIKVSEIVKIIEYLLKKK